MNYLKCEYCEGKNSMLNTKCEHCGAPLPIPKIQVNPETFGEFIRKIEIHIPPEWSQSGYNKK